MRNRLLKWFFLWLGVMFLLILVVAIFGPTAKRISLEEVSFKTTQSSELYFKNIRSYFYEKEEHEESGFYIYRLSSLEQYESPLKFVILQNWKLNEAYIMLELDSLQSSNDPFTIEVEEGGQITLNDLDSQSQYKFAAQVFTAFENNLQLSVKKGESFVSLSERHKKALHKNIGDYFKLVGKIR